MMRITLKTTSKHVRHLTISDIAWILRTLSNHPDKNAYLYMDVGLVWNEKYFKENKNRWKIVEC